MTRKVIAAVAAIFTALVLAGTASAQYPSPQGSLQCTAQVNVSVNDQSKVSATLRDFSGNPVVGETISFSIISGSGSLSSDTATTDANGVAMVVLNAGSNAGNVSVGATYDGLECSAVSQVAGAVVVTPPNTGDAGLAAAQHDGNSTTVLATELIALIALGTICGALWFKYSFNRSHR